MTNTQEFKIEKGIEIPPFWHQTTSKWRTLAESMDNGDSVVVKTKQVSAIRNYLRKAGKKAVARTLPGRETARVWAIKK